MVSLCQSISFSPVFSIVFLLFAAFPFDSPSSTGILSVTDPNIQTAPRAAAGWRYEDKSDNIVGTMYKATLDAGKPIEFPYPYAGGSTVSLIIRHRGGNTNVYLATTKGMFTRSFQGGKAQIRFDNGQPLTYFLTAAANGSGNTVYFDKEQKLVQQIKASKKMTVQLQFTGFPLEALPFNTAGLRWNH
ncbi:MAG: hypothetical protein EOO39_09225 [Cytophagaceae bacterium]|nr:MAG: hypothetical protein EOO39_09225 [Cytophagaceae bacterium]